MADVKQSGASGDNEFAAMRASLERTLAFADWANQLPPPSGPQTAAMTVNEIIVKIAGELARIAACYDLKEAAARFRDAIVAAGSHDPYVVAQFQEALKKIQDAMKRLGCPGMG